MKVFIKHISALETESFICTDVKVSCYKQKRNPCPYCIKVPPYSDWQQYIEHLQWKLSTIVEKM